MNERPSTPGPEHQSVLSGHLSHEELDQLGADLAAWATLLDARVDSKEQSHAGAIGCVSLEEALRLLRSGAARRARIQYRYLGDIWCDTVSAAGAGFRLVRLRQHAQPDETSETG